MVKKLGQGLLPKEEARAGGRREAWRTCSGFQLFPSGMNIFQYFNYQQGHTGALGLYQSMEHLY